MEVPEAGIPGARGAQVVAATHPHGVLREPWFRRGQCVENEGGDDQNCGGVGLRRHREFGWCAQRIPKRIEQSTPVTADAVLRLSVLVNL